MMSLSLSLSLENVGNHLTADWSSENNKPENIEEKSLGLSYQYGGVFHTVDGTMESREYGTFVGGKKKPKNRGVRIHQQTSLDWLKVTPKDLNHRVKEQSTLHIIEPEEITTLKLSDHSYNRLPEADHGSRSVRDNKVVRIQSAHLHDLPTSLLKKNKPQSPVMKALFSMGEKASGNGNFSRSQSAGYLTEDPLARGKDSIDGFFKNSVYTKLSLPQMDVDMQNVKGGFIRRIMDDDFDKKEYNFCKKMIIVRGTQALLSVDPMMDNDLAAIALQHKVAEKRIETQNFKTKIEEANKIKRLTELRSISRRNKAIERTKPMWSEVIVKHRKVFKIENTLQMKKKIDKDPVVTEFIQRRTEVLIKKASSKRIKENIDLANQLQLENMEALEKANQALSKKEMELKGQYVVQRSGIPTKSQGYHSIFDPSVRSRLGESSRGISRTAKTNTRMIDVMILELMKTKRQQKEEQEKQMRLASQPEFSQDNYLV